jgi:hypothetical protein
MTVTRRIRRRGEHEISRKTIARGMPGDFRCDRGDYARVLNLLFAREAAGALGTRHSLHPLFSKGRTSRQKLAWIRGEIAKLYLLLFEKLNLWQFIVCKRRHPMRRPCEGRDP